MDHSNIEDSEEGELMKPSPVSQIAERRKNGEGTSRRMNTSISGASILSNYPPRSSNDESFEISRAQQVVRDLSKNKENRINQLKDLQRRSFENLEEIMRQSVSPKKNLRAVIDKQLPLSTAQKATLKSAKVSPPKQ